MKNTQKLGVALIAVSFVTAAAVQFTTRKLLQVTYVGEQPTGNPQVINVGFVLCLDNYAFLILACAVVGMILLIRGSGKAAPKV